MSIYKKLGEVGIRFFGKDLLFRYGFNLSPMYRRSTARIIAVSKNMMQVRIKLPLSWKNKNYVNSIFGGSMFAAVDPIPMVQLIYLIGDEYVVWDKSAQINFKRPAKEHLYAEFNYTPEELEKIKQQVKENHEIEIVKTTHLTGKDGKVIYCEVLKTVYIAEKSFYKKKREKKRRQAVEQA